MEFKQNVNIHNKFEVVVTDGKTGEVKQKAEAYNIVLDQMYDRLCSGSSYFLNIHFGRGVGTTIPTRTSLFNHIGTKTAITEETIKALPVSKWTRKIVLNPEEYVGETITELGIAYGSTASYLVTHALLQDSEGNTISIEKTATDVVTIYATVFITLNEGYGGKLKLSGIPDSNSLINYMFGSSFPSGSFGLVRNPGIVRIGSSPSVSWSADVLNKKRKTNTVRFDINTGNGDVKALDFTNTFTLEFPVAGVHNGQMYTDVAVGVGDDVVKDWLLPSAYIDPLSISVKLSGVVTTSYMQNTLYMDFFNRLNYPYLKYCTSVALSPDGLMMAVTLDRSPYVATLDWDGSEWVRRPDPGVLPSDYSYGISLTPDGLIMAVAHSSSPYVTTYNWDGSGWVKRPDPDVLPIGIGVSVSLTPDGLIMAVGHSGYPYVSTYDWDGSEWVRRPNPDVLPTGTGYGISLTPDGLIMAVGHSSSPYVTTYDWDGSGWVKRPDPDVLPASISRSVSLTPDGLIMAVGHSSSPYVTTYDWDGSEWVKRPDPDVLPTGTGYGISLTSDGLIMAVAHSGPPCVSTYNWDGSGWVKRPDPDVLAHANGVSVSLTPDGLIMAVGHPASPYVSTYDTTPKTKISFNTPPTTGSAITVDYKVDGVHKTDQYVIDVSMSIQFGEG